MPTHACRPNMAFVYCWPPVATLKPDSSWKMAFVPPPRSSAPLRPKRLPAQIPESILMLERPPLFEPSDVWLLWDEIESSTIPYNVTLFWAKTGEARVARLIRTAFLTVFLAGFLKLCYCMVFLLCLC